MSLLARLGVAFRPETETRATGPNYTDAALEAALNAATGSPRHVAEQTAAAEFGLGLYSRSFAAALIEPSALSPTLPAQARADLARRLMLRGEAVYAIEVNPLGNIRLLPASSHDIEGGPDESTWRYYLDIPGPTRPERRRLPSRAVVHCRIGADPALPWKGCSPLENAGLTTKILARLEQRTGEESNASAGYLLPVPEGTPEESITALRSDLAALKGKVALVESQAAGQGQGRAAAPQSDWRLQRMGAEFPEGNVNLRRQVGADVVAAMGIPAALYVGADGATVREAYRQFLVSTLQPLATLVAEEMERKLEVPALRFNFRRLAAADIAARARAFGSLAQAYAQAAAGGADVDLARLETLAGLNE